MGIHTKISWCDSTANGQMGCNGCELWNPAKGVRHCYAGTLTERYGGAKGWPVTFDQPVIFPKRIEEACRWSDLTGTVRAEKPWLNGLPRMIFLDDMGDTWTEELPLDWLAPHLPGMEAAPHVWMTLTKRPRRMLRAARQHGWPSNFWAGTSVTSKASMLRAATLALMKREFGCTTYLSVEPLLEEVEIASVLPFIDLVIVGGESGKDARPCHTRWVGRVVSDCAEAGVACFVKQLGSRAVTHDDGRDWPNGSRLHVQRSYDDPKWAQFRNSKGESPEEWPEALRVRNFPNVPAQRPEALTNA